MSATAAFAWLVAATGMGCVLSALGAAVVLLLREPARRVRAIELTLLACLVAPWLPAVPGLPRVAWREWLAAPDGAESEIRETASALSEPAEPIAASAVPESTERASSAPIIELAVDPEPSAAPPLDLTVDGAPLLSNEPAVATPIEQAEVPTTVAATAAEPVAPSLPPAAEELTQRPVDWPAVVVTLYLVGVAAIILLDALGGLALLRVWKSSRGAELRVQALLSEVAGQSVGRVSLLVSPRCRQPFTFAWLWPVIVLPPALVASGKERELRWALAHEWSHVANRHTWGWALAGLARAIYWPQPLVWLLRRRLRLEQDFLADAQAAGRAADAPDYATFLTTQAATAHGLTPGLGIAGGKSELARRVVMLVQGKRPVAQCGWKWSLAVAALMTLALVGAAGLSPAEQEPPTSETAAKEQSKESRTEPDADGRGREGDLPSTNDGRLAPGDLVRIDVAGLPATVSGNVWQRLVEPDGRIALEPGYGRVQVGSLAPEEARAAIVAAVKGHESDARVEVARWGHVDRARRRSFPKKYVLKPGEKLHIQSTGFGTGLKEYVEVDATGRIALGDAYGNLDVAGLTPAQAETKIRESVLGRFRGPAGPPVGARIGVTLGTSQGATKAPLPTDQHIQPGQILRVLVNGGPTPRERLNRDVLVEPDGDVSLSSFYGRVSVAGLTFDEAERAIGKKLEALLDKPRVDVMVVLAGWDVADASEVAPAVATDRTQTLSNRETAAAPTADQPATVVAPAPTTNPEIEPFDLLQIHVVGLPPPKVPVEGVAQTERVFGGAVDREGQVSLGARFGRFPVAGLTVDEAEKKILEHLKKTVREDIEAKRLSESSSPLTIQVVVGGRARSMRVLDASSKEVRLIQAGDDLQINTIGAPVLSVGGRFRVEPQGTLALGPELGRVEVTGLTREAAGDRILARIREAVSKYHPGSQNAAIRTNANVSVTFPDSQQPASYKFVPLPEPGHQIVPGNWIGIEALGPSLEPRLLGAATVDSNGSLSLRRSGDRYVHQAGDRLWVVGVDAELPAAGLTERELEAAVRRELEKTGPVSWLKVGLGGYDAREPGWTSSEAPDQAATPTKVAPPSPSTAAASEALAKNVDGKIQPFDLLSIYIVDVPYASRRSETQTSERRNGGLPITGATKVLTVVESDGQALIDARLGRLQLAGLSFAEAEQKVRERAQAAVKEDLAAGRLTAVKAEPAVQVVRQGRAETRSRTRVVEDSPVIKSGDRLHIVPPNGPRSDELGIDYGSIQVESNGEAPFGPRLGRIQVAGLTLLQASERVHARALEVAHASANGRPASPATNLHLTLEGWQPKAERQTLARPAADMPIAPGDTLLIDVVDSDLRHRVLGYFRVLANGEVLLARETSRAAAGVDAHVLVAGKTVAQAEAAILEQLAKTENALWVGVAYWDWVEEDAKKGAAEQVGTRGAAAPTGPPAEPRVVVAGRRVKIVAEGVLPDQPINGEFEVEPDGTVNLGPSYGQIQIVGLTEAEAARRIKRELSRLVTEPEVQVALPEPRTALRYSGKSFEQWREVLQNDLDPAARVEAIKALGKFGANGLATEAAEAIVPYIGFRDGDENVVYATAQEEMRKIGEPALPIVLVAFDSSDAKIREAASHLLSQMPTDDLALTALVKALDDKSSSVRIAAAGALGAKRHELERAGDVLDQAAQLGDDQLLPTISMYLTNYFPPTEERLQIVSDYLAKTPPQMRILHFGQRDATNPEFVVRLMQKQLEEAMKRSARREPRGRRGALDGDRLNGFVEPLRVLERLGPEAAPALPTILKLAEEPDAPNFFDMHIVQALRAIGPAAAPTARPVLERLRDQSPSPNRKIYFDGLLRSWDEAAQSAEAEPEEASSKTTDMPAEVRRQYAGKSFAQWKAVLEKDLDPATRIEAIAAIGEFGASGQADEAIRVLAPLLGSQAASDKKSVAMAAQESLAKIGAAAVPALLEALKNGNDNARYQAIEALNRMGDAAAPAAEALLEEAKRRESEPGWLRALVRAIARIQSRPEATLPFLTEMARSHDQDIRAAAVDGLSGLKVPDEQVVPLIVDSIWSAGTGTRQPNFFRQVRITGGRTLAVMRGLLERAKGDAASSDEMVTALFVFAAEMGPAAAPLVPLMIEVSQHDPSWQQASHTLVTALERIGPGAKEALTYLRARRDGQAVPAFREQIDNAINAIEGSQ